MSKNDKKPAAASSSTVSEKWYEKTLKKLIPVIDWTLKGVAGAFILATSFCFVRNWLQDNRLNHDFSMAGAILVMTVALYLLVRKR